MIILGLDPGTATTGFGILQKEKTGKLKILNFGVISTSPKKTAPNRLLELALDLNDLIKKYKPTRAGVEKLYFETNQKTAMSVAEARGVIMLTLAQKNIPIVELTPLQVKNATTGYGKADKKQMQISVQKQLGLKNPIKPDDAADALAIAICTSARQGI